jgi:hypothetical protein
MNNGLTGSWHKKNSNFRIPDNPGVERLVRPVGRALAIWLDCFNLDQKAIRYVR